MYRLKRENTISTNGKATVQADKDKFKINIDGKSNTSRFQSMFSFSC